MGYNCLKVKIYLPPSKMINNPRSCKQKATARNLAPKRYPLFNLEDALEI